MIAPNTTAPVPLSPGEEQAIAELYARERAIAASGPNRMFHAIVRTARELQERLLVFMEETSTEASKKILADAGLEDPEDATRFGSNSFEESRERSKTLVDELEQFISFAGNDLPEPPTAQPERGQS